MGKGGVDIEKRRGFVTMGIEEGLKDTSPSPSQGLSLFDRNIVVSFVPIHYFVKERKY